MRTHHTAASLVLAIALTAVFACGCAPTSAGDNPSDESQETSVTLFGFTAASTTQMRADAIAEAVRIEHPEWMVSSMAAGGEARLMEKRLAGEADLFFPPAPWPIEQPAVGPLHPGIDFEEAAGYRLVMPSSFLYVHFLALGKTGLETPADIITHRYPFKIGGGAGVGRYVFDCILAHYDSSMDEAETWGASYEVLYMSSAEGVAALQSGRLDMGFTWLGIPGAHFLGADFDLRLLKFTEPELVAAMRDLGLVQTTIPASTYPFLSEDVPTVAAYQPLVARTDLPDDVVYEVAKAIFEHQELLAVADPLAAKNISREAVVEAIELSAEIGPAFHPGAMRYYREVGWVA